MKDLALLSFTLDELTEALGKKMIDLFKNDGFLLATSKENEKEKEKEFLTRRETANICNVKSLATLWNWEQKGDLVPCAKAGRKPLYLSSDVKNFLYRKEAQND